MSEEDQEYLARLLESKKTYEDSLTYLKKQLEIESDLARRGRRIRRTRGYNMGQDLDNNPPCGAKYLNKLERIIIPSIVNNIYSANSNIKRTTSQIEKLTGVAVPAAEEVEEVAEVMGPSVAAPASVAALKKLRRMSSSSSSDGYGRRSRRKRKKKKRTRRHRRRHRRSTGRNKRKSRKYH